VADAALAPNAMAIAALMRRHLQMAASDLPRPVESTTSRCCPAAPAPCVSRWI